MASYMTDAEENALKLTSKRLGDIADEIFKDGTPTDNKDIRVFIEVSAQADDSILRLAKLRQESEQGMSDQELKKDFIAFFAQSKLDIQPVIEVEEIPEAVIAEIEILDTEKNMERETLSLEDFVEGD